MADKKIVFESDQGTELEGKIFSGSTESGVVISHPHPLYGGDMYNIVVETIAATFWKSGHTTLRFNFRGTGNSRGSYDEGNGEQQDVEAACRLLREKGISKLTLAGYSFGAWVNCFAANKISFEQMILVSPPVAMLPFSEIEPIKYPILSVTGSHDEFAPPGLVKKVLLDCNPKACIEVIDGADHFYFGYTRDLEQVLSNYLREK